MFEIAIFAKAPLGFSPRKQCLTDALGVACHVGKLLDYGLLEQPMFDLQEPLSLVLL